MGHREVFRVARARVFPKQKDRCTRSISVLHTITLQIGGCKRGRQKIIELPAGMFQIPDNNVSVALSEVLSELGVNDVIVNQRRRTYLVTEKMVTVWQRMTGKNGSTYIFGSQSEGTTTIGLNSDVDMVKCSCDKNVINEWRDLKHGVLNLLMVEDEFTSPGYCMLQVLRSDASVPVTEIVNKHCFRDRQGRLLLKNTADRLEGHKQHGPASTCREENGAAKVDDVLAYTCASQLPVVQHWLSQLQGPWPSEDIKEDIASSPCFVVPVGNRGSIFETLEWRISTSLAERCLMFSLNVTQLQVYVLMKMLLKTSINCNVRKKNRISTFMCKTVVLHCVQHTAPNAWQSHMLIQCLLFSLFTLYLCVLIENCPHFIIRSNNLMAGRFTQQAKHQLQKNLLWLLDDILPRGILCIYIDQVADRLRRKINPGVFGILGRPNDETCQTICYSLGIQCARSTQGVATNVLGELTENRLARPITLIQQGFRRLEHVYSDRSEIERSACRLLRPYFYTMLGSLLASESIQNSSMISNQTLDFFSRGLNSDVASSRLKLASVLFCAGQMERAETILRDVESRYDRNVCSPVCGCKPIETRHVLTRLEAWSLASDESYIPMLTSACVFFTQAEKNCIPQELQYEIQYRSTQEDLQYKKIYDAWMDSAVVDSLPYLHFLCYKVYGRLQRHADQQNALYNLMVAIQTEPNLHHKETALNLLGQCMEQEDMWNYALQCYSWSLDIRPRNNAANFHVRRLLKINEIGTPS